MDRPSSAPRVLILEDEPIIAIDVENILMDGGMAVAGTLRSCADALIWLESNDADVALMDMHLLDGSCEPVARRLLERGIPFAIFSGGSESDETLDPIFSSGIWLEKPARPDRIMAAVQAAARTKSKSSGDAL